MGDGWGSYLACNPSQKSWQVVNLSYRMIWNSIFWMEQVAGWLGLLVRQWGCFDLICPTLSVFPSPSLLLIRTIILYIVFNRAKFQFPAKSSFTFKICNECRRRGRRFTLSLTLVLCKSRSSRYALVLLWALARVRTPTHSTEDWIQHPLTQSFSLPFLSYSLLASPASTLRFLGLLVQRAMSMCLST